MVCVKVSELKSTCFPDIIECALVLFHNLPFIISLVLIVFVHKPKYLMKMLMVV